MPFVEYRLGGGLNLKAEPTKIADNQLQEAFGCRFDVAGAVSSDLGRTVLQTYTRGRILGIVDSYRDEVARKIVKSGSQVYEESVSLGTFATTGYLSGASYNDYTYIADGSNVKRWDGTTLEAVGLDAPTTACTATAASGTGGDMYPGVYKYWVTFFNGVAESNFSPVATVTVEAADDGVDLSAIPVGGSTVTARRLYRSDINSSAKYFIAELADNTTTTYQDTDALAPGADEEATPGDDPVDVKSEAGGVIIAEKITNRQAAKHQPSTSLQTTFPQLKKSSEAGDASERQQIIMSNLGALADWTDHFPPPTDLKSLVFHQEQFFAISGDDVVFSRPGEPEHWPVFNRFRPGRRSAEKLLRILPLDSDLILYTDSSVYRLSSQGAGFTPATVRLQQLDSPVGLVGELAVTSVTLAGVMVHVFIARTGIYLCDGRQVQEIGLMVEGLFDDRGHSDSISEETIALITLGSHRDKVWASYNDGTRTLMMDFESPQNPQFSILREGYTFLMREHRDARLLGGDRSGKVYHIATERPASSTYWAPRTKDFVFGEGMRSVVFSEVVLDADVDGGMVVTVRTDTGGICRRWLTARGRLRHRFNLPMTFRGHSISVGIESTNLARRYWYGVGFNVESESEP